MPYSNRLIIKIILLLVMINASFICFGRITIEASSSHTITITFISPLTEADFSIHLKKVEWQCNKDYVLMLETHSGLTKEDIFLLNRKYFSFSHMLLRNIIFPHGFFNLYIVSDLPDECNPALELAMTSLKKYIGQNFLSRLPLYTSKL